MSSFKESIKNSNAGAYLLVFLSFLLFAILGTILFLLMGVHLSSFVTQFVCILGAAVLWRLILKDAAAKWPKFGLTISPQALIVSILAAVSLGMLASSLASILIESSDFLRSFAEDYMAQIAELITEATGWQRAVGILAVCVAAPICEEALFRGTILQEQRKVERVAVAVTINGFMFAAFHLNPISAPGLWILGAFLAHLTLRSGSILPAVLAHAALNTTNALIIPAITSTGAEVAESGSTPISEMLLVALGLAALSAALWWAVLKLIPARPAATSSEV